VLREYVAYYNTHRPHRSLDQQPPLVETAPASAHEHEWHVRRHDRLGGLLHDYELVAQQIAAVIAASAVPGVQGDRRLKHLRAE
jgi:hypothetical protein